MRKFCGIQWFKRQFEFEDCIYRIRTMRKNHSRECMISKIITGVNETSELNKDDKDGTI